MSAGWWQVLGAAVWLLWGCLLSDALATDADGGGLFAQRCAVCHGDDAAGRLGPAIRCHRSIRQAVRTGRPVRPTAMPAFPDFSDAQIDAIQAWLRTRCPSPDGSTLYTTHCARCHGEMGDGTRAAPPATCATRLGDALKRGRGDAMPEMPGLDDTEVAAIQRFLDGRCAQRGQPLDVVYAANCGTCHGRNAAGGRNALWSEGPDIRCTAHDDYIEAVERGWGGMPRFPALAHATVEGLYRRVHRGRCPAPR
ncbi:MAG TPA: c-type cytochrome [Candidatus Binatus sp.]|nr:c-type cytochrome [Candidatus Binatus sp.]